MIPLAPALAFLKRPTVLIIAGSLAFSGLQSYRLNSCKRHSAEDALVHAEEKADAARKASEALSAAISERDAQIQQLKEKGRLSVSQAVSAAEKAKSEAAALRERLKSAQREDADCDAWAKQEIRCPIK